MQAHRIETVVEQNGKLVIEQLPFNAGDLVEVIILERQSKTENSESYPLRGSVYRYDNPFEPAVPSED